MLWTDEVIENNATNFSIFDNEMYQRDNCIKNDIWSNVILLVSITLFCDQRRKSESLEERRKIMKQLKNCVFFRLGVSSFFSLALYI